MEDEEYQVEEWLNNVVDGFVDHIGITTILTPKNIWRRR